MSEPRDHTRPRQRSIDQIDRTTGEVLSEGALVWVPNRTPHPYGNRWMAMTLDGLDKLTATPGIGMREMRIFAVLLKRLDHENFILVPQVEIVKATGFHASHVSSSMKRLVEVGALITGPKSRTISDLSLIARNRMERQQKEPPNCSECNRRR